MLDSYINNLSRRYLLGNSTEHTFRGDLQQLIETLAPGIQATNEPRRQSCGAPDFILTKKDIPIGYIEAKDLGNPDLDGTRRTGNKEQFDRYKTSLENLIFTDYINFHLYRESRLVTKISIGEIGAKGVKPLPENFPLFEGLIKDFTLHVGQTIKSPKKLAVMMAGKAKLLSEIIERAVTSDESNRQDSTLKDQMRAFKKVLIHEITPKEFADVYAQTLAYGMFAARFVDPSITSFSRQEAAELIPRSNPFLRKLFGYIAGPEIDDRIKWIVDSLAEIFLACDVQKILKNFGKPTQTEDPVVHFYETFLSEYDPKLRKARGVWYTPRPVVDFIVRAVDDILKTEFDLPQGLADTSKVRIPVISTNATDIKNGGEPTEKEVHRVQILDPATGTGTFLAEVVKNIHKKFEGQQGMWSRYVENHLLPRLNGFELLMASYAMAHLKMGMLLTETGYRPIDNPRLKIFLTNSLEEHADDSSSLFSSWLSEEAKQASEIKRETPVMCIIGNPPYSGESSNKGKWIMDLMEDYKKEPGGKEKLKEQNFKFINDDYVKFLRLGQHLIDKNEEGILAFINPHGYLDNFTFRGMRWNLLKSFQKIYTIDLHGNSKKKEISSDGSVDQNVFDIMQGVSINIFIKKKGDKSEELAQIFHYDLYGKRELKYNFLLKNNIKSIPFKSVKSENPDFYFVWKDYMLKNIYNKNFALNELFPLSSLGFLTKRDNLSIDFTQPSLQKKITYFLDPMKSTEQVCNTFKLVIKDNDKWNANVARVNVNKDKILQEIRSCHYRPFDFRKIYYNQNYVARPNVKILGNFSSKNYGLILGKQGQAVGQMEWNLSFITNSICDQNIYYRGGGTVFPLYIYSETKDGRAVGIDGKKQSANLNEKILNKIADKLGLEYTLEKEEFSKAFAPIDLLDYIYAILHSPSYRRKYKEFLKIDFPRVPYPENTEIFWQLVTLGRELREIHLLESPIVENYITQFPMDGDNIITRKITSASPGYEPLNETHGRVWINEQQYFDKVPLVAWEFYIGGYQPAQKWLKDRKGRELSYEDILHYQKMIVALTETYRIMKEIDKVPFLDHGEKHSDRNSAEDPKFQKTPSSSVREITVVDPYWERSLAKRVAKKRKDPAGN